MQLREFRWTRALALMLLLCALGFALLAAAFCLPTAPIRAHVQGSAATFRDGGNRPQVIASYPGTTGDGYTDALMLAEAIFEDPDTTLLERIVYVYRWAGSESMSADLADQLDGTREMPWRIGYERYWHGYLALLRPLLLLFTYDDLLVLMAMAQVLLFALAVALMARRGAARLILPFAAMQLTLSPTGTMLSMQYFSVYLVMLLGVLLILLMDEWLCRGARYVYLFLLLGMLTSYLDFLTYPLAALGVPLAVLCWLHRARRSLVPVAAAACAAWCAGYLGFWALKWAAGSLLVGENLIRSALYRVLYQTSTEHAVTAGRWDAIAANVAVICRPGYAALYLLCAAGCAWPVLRGRCRARTLLSGSRPLLPAIGMMPFAWWLLAANHSLVHTFFTYRGIAVTVLAVLAWLASAEP